MFFLSWGLEFSCLLTSREGVLPMSLWSLVSGSGFEWRLFSVKLVGFTYFYELVDMRF